LGVFGLASLACAAAPTVGALIAARGVQAIGGAAIAVTSFALLGAVYRGPDMGRAMGVFGAITGLAAATGPLLAGMAAFAACAGSLTYAVTRATEDGWATPLVLALLAIAVGSLAIFITVERGHSAPLLDVRLFRQVRFSAVMACVIASTAAFAALVYVSLWLQAGLRLGALHAGVALMPLAAASFLTSLLTGRRLHGRSPRAILGTGLFLTGLGAALQTGLDAGSTAASLIVGLTVTGIGVGLLGPALGAAVFAALPPERAGMAAGAMTLSGN
jgi:MFS family permease